MAAAEPSDTDVPGPLMAVTGLNSHVVATDISQPSANTLQLAKRYTVYTDKVIGKGTYGTVYEALDNKKRKNKEVAAKKIQPGPNVEVNDILTEIKNVYNIEPHVNVVHLSNYFEKGGMFWLIMEYCDLGDMEIYFKKYSPDFEAQLRFMLMAASGLCHMHGLKHPVIHRDLKPANILFKLENGSPILKIADFGLAKKIDFASTRDYTALMSSKAGTPRYMAPELFGDEDYTKHVDTFSLGLVYLSMIRHQPGQGIGLPLAEGAEKGTSPFTLGQEMAYAMSRGHELPTVVSIKTDDDQRLKTLKQLIIDMTKPTYSERRKLDEVKEELESLLKGRCDDRDLEEIEGASATRPRVRVIKKVVTQSTAVKETVYERSPPPREPVMETPEGCATAPPRPTDISPQKLSLETSQGIKVVVYHSSMVNQQTQGIVNIVRDDSEPLITGEGDILQAAGETAIDEYLKNVQDMGGLKTGQCFHTTPGDLPFIKNIIHVKVDYCIKDEGLSPYEAYVDIYHNLLCHADTHPKLSSLTLPGTLLGEEDLDIPKAAQALYEAILKFSKYTRKSLRNLHEICIINSDPHKAEMLKKTFKDLTEKQFGKYVDAFMFITTPCDLPDAFNKKMSLGAGAAKISKRVHFAESPDRSLQGPSPPKVPQMHLETTEGINVLLYQSRLTDQRAEGIVSVISESSAGLFPQYLRETAGQQVWDEYNRQKKTAGNSCFHTSAGFISQAARYLIHVPGDFPMDKTTNKFKMFCSILGNALRYANTTLQLSSVTLPVLKSDDGEEDVDLYGNSAFHSILKFSKRSKEHGSNSLTEIHIVNPDKKITCWLRNSFADLVPTNPSEQGSFMFILEDSIGETKASSEGTRTDIVSKLPVLKLRTSEDIVVKVYKANMIAQSTEALVSPCGKNLELDEGICSMISSAAGPEVKNECRGYISQHGSLEETEVMHTSAGSLPFPIQNICFAARPSYGYGQEADYTRKLQQTFTSCLQYASNFLKVKSISIPAISMGFRGFGSEATSQALFDAIMEFSYSVKNSLQELRDIHIIDQRKDVVFEMQKNLRCLVENSQNRTHQQNPTLIFIVDGDD